jgi:NAD-dependent dihydropyrimidine dehydrogenase PreA subunit
MPAVAPEKCDGCKSCEIICPDFAIFTVKEK